MSQPAASDADVSSRKLLRIYLSDHLAGSAAGISLVRRCIRSNTDNHVGRALADVARELEDARAELEAVLSALGMRGSAVKQVATAMLERVGRLKLNGTLVGYSPLSRVVELEGLCIALEGQRNLWRTLEVVSSDRGALADGVDPAARRRRTEELVDQVRALRKDAARTAFTDAPLAPSADADGEVRA